MKPRHVKETRLPKTLPELHHMLTMAQNEGAGHALEIVLFVLLDKHGWDKDQLKTLMDGVASQAQAITQGYTTVKDIRRVLREEYEVEV